LQNLKKEPAYGADILRLWSASVEYWRDMSLGPTVLSQTAETYRKIRNSARFALGNIDGVEGRAVVEKVPREQLGLVSLVTLILKGKQLTSVTQIERYVMHELYNLERTALDGYATYNFPKGESCTRGTKANADYFLQLSTPWLISRTSHSPLFISTSRRIVYMQTLKRASTDAKP
jgi:isoleucyl-tRNA synthetase